MEYLLVIFKTIYVKIKVNIYYCNLYCLASIAFCGKIYP